MPTTASLKDKKNEIVSEVKNSREAAQLKDAARETASELKGWANRINTLAHDLFDSANDEFSNARAVTTRQIRKTPLQAAAAAFAVGYLIRALTSK